MINSKKTKIALLGGLFLMFSGILKSMEIDPYPIIPNPFHLIEKEGEFKINLKTTIKNENRTEFINAVAIFLQKELIKTTDLHLKIENRANNKNVIAFLLDTTIVHLEGYELDINKHNVIIKYKTAHGAFNAVQSLLQLLPANIENKALTALIPAVNIIDYPKLEYRGYMLDVARHFYPVAFLKKMIDVMAFYKLNVLHLHLTDDQGWRIQIKKYPRLHEVGAWRDETQNGHRTDEPITFDGKRHGGYYTQEELRDIVEYAKERFIRVIPEIDIPGHSQAILAAYPQLGCIDSTYTVSKIWGVHDNILCPTEETFEFLENVFDEVISIFPDKNIHMGGDEVPKTRWKESSYCQELISRLGLKDEDGLQSYFVKRVQAYLDSKGRKIIGWDEILEGGLADGATVMSWRGEKGGVKAAEMGNPVIMTPSKNMYLNYYNTKHKKNLEPLANSAVLTLKEVYEYQPIPERIMESKKQYVIGLQACLWTEYCKTPEQAESLTFPRLCAMSEVAWTSHESKDYNDFFNRLKVNVGHLRRKSINYSKLFLDRKNNE